MGRNNTYAALRADAASTENAEELAALIMLMTNSPELGRRASAARPDISQLAQHRIDATAAGQAMQWVLNDAGTGVELRAVQRGADGGIDFLQTLESEGLSKLAQSSGKDKKRQQAAQELARLSRQFSPNMSPKTIKSKAATKYASINNRGKEAHHIFPISYMHKVLNKLDEQGIQKDVLNEMARRKMTVGDTPANLSALATTETAGDKAYLEPIDKRSVVDKHDAVHRLTGQILDELNLPRENVKNNSIEQFMNNPDKTDYQKKAVAMAIPEAHRLAIQSVMLDPTTSANQDRLLNSIVRLAADTAQSDTKLSPLSQRMLRKVHGQRF